ncbi:hypothetical protein TcCL_NonESM10339, partial [Trypanosoma cruzi]
MAAASQSPTRVPVATDSLRRWMRSALARWRCTATSPGRFVPCRFHWWIEVTQLVSNVHHDTAESHAMRLLTNKPRWHDPSRRRTAQSGTWTFLLQSGARTGGMPRRKRRARAPHERRLSVWQGLYSWHGPDIVPRAAALRTGTVRLPPTPRHACACPADHKEPSVSVVPFLPHCGDRPAAASAGSSSRREHRNSLSTSERRIDVLLPNLRQSTLVRPQYECACPTCSAWRSDSLTGLTCGCHNGASVFLTGASRTGRHRKCQARRQVRHAGSTSAGTRDGPCPYATASSQTPRAADPTTDRSRRMCMRWSLVCRSCLLLPLPSVCWCCGM